MSKALDGTGLGQVIDWISTRVFKKSEAVTVQTLSIDSTPTQNSSNLVTSGGVYNAILSVSGKEDTANKVTSLSSSSTDTQYPSAKCVYDIVGDIETLINAL